MARTVNEFPERKRDPNAQGIQSRNNVYTNSFNGNATKYPWNKWLDGRIWILVKDKDFKIQCESIRIIAINYARDQGLAVRTRVQGDKVYIQMIGEYDER
jgi:hypothetical protein